MNPAETVVRAGGTLAVVAMAVLQVGTYLYTERVEFNEFDPLYSLAIIAQLLGPPILCIIAAGAAIEATASACLRGRGARTAAAWSGLILWIVAGAQIIFARVAWTP